MKNKHNKKRNSTNNTKPKKLKVDNTPYNQNQLVNNDTEIIDTLNNESIDSKKPVTKEENKAADQDFDTLVANCFNCLVESTKICNKSYPFNNQGEFNVQATIDKNFKKKTEEQSHTILKLLGDIMEGQTTNGDSISPQTDAVDIFDRAVDFVDNCLERADISIDEYLNKRITGNDYLQKIFEKKSPAKKFSHGDNIPRPQDHWNDFDNSHEPFVPKITHKPNALKPLELVKTQNGYSNPYEFEIQNYMEHLSKQFQNQSVDIFGPKKDQMYQPLNLTSCTWIDTVEKLNNLIAVLEQVEEFAVDLEAHSYRSFQGFVCLMQISTRKEDFLVDALELRGQMHLLNQVFTNPRILKVFHGSDQDILWLQRDLGIYVVNMFDTGQASRILEYPSFALAYLLKVFCSIEADKKYQLADWRIRPLPSEMVKYAREDTHYLLYVYDKLRNELLARGPNYLFQMLKRSQELTLKTYEKELFLEDSYLVLFRKSNLSFTQKQLNVLRALYKWRDHVAREDDDSTRYVLPNHMMFRIAEVMPLDNTKLIHCIHPVPHALRKHATNVVKIISHATVGKFEDKYIRGYVNNNKKTRSQNVMATPTATSEGSGDSMLITPVKLSFNNEMTNTHMIMESPVMTTEQLYQSAGWIEQPTGQGFMQRGNSGNGNVALPSSHIISSSGPQTTNIGGVGTNHPSILHFKIDMDSEDTDDSDADSNISVEMQDADPLQDQSEDSDSDSDSEGEQELITITKLMSAQKKAPQISVSTNSSFFSIDHNMDSDEKDSDLEDDSTRKVETIKQQFSLVPKEMSMLSQQLNRPQTTERTHVKQSSLNSTTSSTDGQDSANEADNAPTGNSQPKTSGKSNKVPKTLDEIYKLAKKNRKVNKEKKREEKQHKSHSALSSSLEDSYDLNDVPSSNQQNVNSQPPIDFMKNIGWLSSDAQISLPNYNTGGISESNSIEDLSSIPSLSSVNLSTSAPKNNNAPNTSGNNNSTVNSNNTVKHKKSSSYDGFVPFDYSQHISSTNKLENHRNTLGQKPGRFDNAIPNTFYNPFANQRNNNMSMRNNNNNNNNGGGMQHVRSRSASNNKTLTYKTNNNNTNSSNGAPTVIRSTNPNPNPSVQNKYNRQ